MYTTYTGSESEDDLRAAIAAFENSAMATVWLENQRGGRTNRVYLHWTKAAEKFRSARDLLDEAP